MVRRALANQGDATLRAALLHAGHALAVREGDAALRADARAPGPQLRSLGAPPTGAPATTTTGATTTAHASTHASTRSGSGSLLC